MPISGKHAIILISGILALFGQTAAEDVPTGSPLPVFGRNYHLGELLKYEMKGSNRGWEYQIQSDNAVKKDGDGVFYEEIGWSNLRSNAPMTLSSASLEFRQMLSLAPTTKYLAIPDLSNVQPFLIGPITDMLTFYSDVFLAKQLQLTRVGQHAYFQHGTPNSWADGQQVALGQDSIDFDLTLLDIDVQKHAATFLIRHVPPKRPQVHLPAKWMEAPVADTANNWVEVKKSDGKYKAQVGQEQFDVHITLDTRDGKILSAQLHNPVVFVSRSCQDANLLNCDGPKSEALVRNVSLDLMQ